MKYIDPHIHCVSRTTDDYQFMQRCGVVGVSEPAFWADFDRSSAASFADYFRHLTDVEPQRAAKYGIDHYSWLCINAKEAEDVSLSRQVIKLIPPLLNHPRVLGVGEIGLNKNTRNEITIFEEQVDVAAKHNQLILIHTPHLEDKHKGTSIITSILKNDQRIKPERVLIDHCEEHTIRMASDAGFWAGMTIYTVSKVLPVRGADMLLASLGHEDWAEVDPSLAEEAERRIDALDRGEDRSHPAADVIKDLLARVKDGR